MPSLAVRVTPPPGSEHGSWKGGRARAEGGYVLVQPAPEDMPFVDRLRSGGYILEHRLVMAKHLGRPLRPWETVHHKNTKRRDDNSIGNLQLRQGSHGQGGVLVCHDCGSHNVGPGEL